MFVFMSVCFSTRVISTNHPPLCQEVAGLPLRLTSFPVQVIAIALFSTLSSSCLFSVHTHIDSYLKELLRQKRKFCHHLFTLRLLTFLRGPQKEYLKKDAKNTIKVSLKLYNIFF